MQMRASGAAGGAHQPQHVARPDRLPGLDVDSGEVAKYRFIAIAVHEPHDVAVSPLHPGKAYPAVGGGAYRVARVAFDVQSPVVFGAPPAEGVGPVAVMRGQRPAMGRAQRGALQGLQEGFGIFGEAPREGQGARRCGGKDGTTGRWCGFAWLRFDGGRLDVYAPLPEVVLQVGYDLFGFAEGLDLGVDFR